MQDTGKTGNCNLIAFSLLVDEYSIILSCLVDLQVPDPAQHGFQFLL